MRLANHLVAFGIITLFVVGAIYLEMPLALIILLGLFLAFILAWGNQAGQWPWRDYENKPRTLEDELMDLPADERRKVMNIFRPQIERHKKKKDGEPKP
jgi:hypothetical protein